jgi:hypothetical protein
MNLGNKHGSVLKSVGLKTGFKSGIGHKVEPQAMTNLMNHHRSNPSHPFQPAMPAGHNEFQPTGLSHKKSLKSKSGLEK